MKTRRPMFAILGVVLAAGSVASCDDTDGSASSVTSVAPTTVVELSSQSSDSELSGHEGDHPEIEAIPISDLTEAEAEAILFMREEEKLARDVYVALNELWDLRVFANISRSETSHMDAVGELIERYGLDDPIGEPGEFANADLQVLYDDLMTLGSQSLTDALVVGATIEDVDIVDLRERLAQTDNEDIELVFDNLIRSSENHLRAFTRQLDRRGVSYEPQRLTQTQYDEILAG